MSEDVSSLREVRIVLGRITPDGSYDECLPCGSDRLPYLVLLPSVEEPSTTVPPSPYHLLSVLRPDVRKLGEVFTSPYHTSHRKEKNLFLVSN